MTVLLTITGIMLLSYVALLIISCNHADNAQLMRFEHLRFTYDNDGRKYANIPLTNPNSPNTYRLRISEFSDFGNTFYMVVIQKNETFFKAQDFCTKDEVSDLMEYYQTIKD